MKNKTSFLMAGLVVTAVLPSLAFGAPIDPNNLVIFRSGDGSAALGSTGTKIFLDEYTTAGGFVQSIAINSTTGDAGRMVTVGSGTTEGIMSRSQDGTKLVFTGYRRNVGDASPAGSGNKVVATIGIGGIANTATEISDMAATNLRSAATVDGSSFYLGGSGSVRYMANTALTTSVSIDARNSRQVALYNNVLYASNGSTSVTNKLQSYGPLPTGATTPTAVATLGTADAINGFVFADLDSGIAGVDTAYALSTVQSQLQKYTFNGTSWSLTGTVSTTAANITAFQNGTKVDLYMTTASKLIKLSDASGYGGTLAGTTTDLVTAATNTGFRGISSFNAVPEPSSILALGLGAIAMMRRKKSR